MNYFQIPEQAEAKITFKNGMTTTWWAAIEAPGEIKYFKKKKTSEKIPANAKTMRKLKVKAIELINTYPIDLKDEDTWHTSS